MTTSSLENKNVVVCVDGGSDSYVAADVVRRLIRQGAAVDVAVTDAVERWLPGLTLATVSRGPVARVAGEGALLGERADGVLLLSVGVDTLVNLLAERVADAACGAFLASRGPRLLAPGSDLPEAPWTKALLAEIGERAEVTGASANPHEIVEAFRAVMAPRDLLGRKVLVTAGPTRETIDPVRFISNPSSGRMGQALAVAAFRRGADVTLLRGPTHLRAPAGVRTLPFTTADELWQLASSEAPDADVVIAAAAVGDYAPIEPSTEKIKKREGEWLLRLGRTPDVLGRLGRSFAERETRPLLVGFAAETEHMLDNARRKLEGKALDLIVANDVGREDSGFATRDIEVVLLGATGTEHLPKGTKESVANLILDRVVSMLGPEEAG